MAAVVAQLADALGGGAPIVDLGAGKGYLGAALARPGRPVLGLELSAGNTQAAEHRVARLHGAKGRRRTGQDQCNGESRTPAGSEWLRTATVSVSADTDVAQLVAAHFPTPAAQLTLAGLHTCGDLAPTAVRIFLRTPAARALCLVGCCYHLLSEPGAGFSVSKPSAGFPASEPSAGFPASEPSAGFPVSEPSAGFPASEPSAGFPVSEPSAGFPLSRRLRGCVLGRNARMLAQQSLERSLDDVDQLLTSVRGLHWRALLETLLPADRGPAHRVGRLAARCGSFPEYARRALEKLGVRHQPSVEELAALATLHEHSWRRMRSLALLRLALAPVVERLLLLDRAQMLLEQGITRWFLVRLFEPLVSPRCFALVALKEPTTDSCDSS